MPDLETRLAALPPEARRLLELRLRAEKTQAASAPVRRGAERAPLSFAQRRLWFLDRLEPGSLYNSPLALRVHGALDAAALERALAEVVRRHESLRTVIRADDGAEPEQVVLPAGAFHLPADDLSALLEAQREEQARRIVHDEIRRPFDLAAGPVFRARLLRLSSDEHVLVLAMHHVVCDGWSLGVLFRELGAQYAAFSRGAPSPLEPLPLQYADYAAWQRAHWTEERLAEQLEWWTRALAGAPAVLEIPADRPRPAVQSHRGGRLRVTLPHALAERVRELARREGATPFMVMLAAFHVLLWRWSGEDDVVVGTPVAGRTRAETEGLIGFFINSLPLRADLSGDPAFAALLHRVRDTTLGAYQHQELPFERLVEALHPGRSLSHAPVFQAMFALQNASPAELRLPGVRMEIVPTETGMARFDLEFLFWEREEGITGTIDYAADLFDAATVERMIGHYRRLLEAAVARPDARVSTLPMLGEAERAQVLREWNRTERGFADVCIHHLFQAQAARTPDALAVTDGSASLTFAALDERANRLARHLAAMGVGPEVRVGICLRRGVEMLVAVLGVLKAGGAYVPLDPGFPAERLRWMLDDSGAAVLLTHEPALGSIPDGIGARVVMVDREWPAIQARDPRPPAVSIDPANLVYLIYTSGSTGRPKGVAMHHRGVSNYLQWAARAYDADRGNGSAVFTSLAVDLTVTSLLPLFAGRPVRMLPDESPVEALAQALRERPGFGILKLTPVHLGVLGGMLSPEELAAAAHTLVVGGEVLQAEHTAFWRDHAPGVRVVNEYGPTETVVGCSAYVVPAGVHLRGALPVGRPIQNLRFYVLDARLAPVPAGVPGELYVGGVAVARGYLGRPGLTAEKFVPDPFAGSGARMYRTGDRARWLAGELVILGRADHQVKVRGHRVEPGEIESALRRHPAVADAAVDVTGDGEQRRLAAWIVPAPGTAGAPAEALRAHLRRDLPDFMVPQAFVVLDRLPLGSSGKVDRRALPAPDPGGEAAAYVTPRTDAERTVAEVFARVLGVERVGAADDFFALGGHSLLAIHACTHLRDRTGAALPLRALFESPTVEGLAAAVEAAPRAEAAVRIVPRPRGDGVEIEVHGERVRAHASPVSFSQQRLWMLDRMDPGRAIYAAPLALRMRGALDRHALQRALDALVERHESLRTVFRWMEGGPMQLVLPRGALPIEAVDLTWLEGRDREAELRRRLADASALPFDLEEGPLGRAVLYRLDAAEHVLLLNLHHVVTDGWSTRVLLRDVEALYAAFGRGEPSPPAPPALQYADYAAWQRDRMRGPAYAEQLAYWKRALAGAPALLELLADRPRPPVHDGRGAAERFRLPREMADAVEALARAEGCTPFMVLLAAFQALLGRYARQEDVVVGTPVANRARPETQDVVGFFVNTLALRGDLSGDPPFRALLRRVRDAALDAFAHQEMPFERLVDELKVPRSAAHAPVFQVMFSMQAAGDGDASLAGLDVQRVPVPGAHAPFDLTLTLLPDEEGMLGALEYATALFDRDTAQRLIAHFRTLLAAAAASPDARLSALPLLTADEVDAALRAWEGPPLDSPPSTIHARIAEQAARTPDAVAVEGGGARLTYRELDDRAARLATRLRDLGVRPGTIAAVRAERSVEAVIAILAVLKAGGAYLPLDPSYPADRQAYMLADSGAALLLDATGAGAPHGWPGRAADLAAEIVIGAEAPAVPCSLFPVPCSPDDLAYVIYTSGSTGRPKGVAVPHRALSAYVDSARQAYALTAADRFLQFAPLSFDSSVEELFAPLAIGATMVLRDGEMMESVDGFWRAAERLSLTIASLPTALWHEIAAAMDRSAPPIPPSLRIMIIGGERALPERVASWRRRVGDRVRLINSYGPTETTVAATLHEVDSAEATVPIGRPMPGYRVRVLDDALRPVPAGVPGELCIGGIGVARGYLGRPALTAERFVPDPFADTPGARLYRTGDLVRWKEVRECESAPVRKWSDDKASRDVAAALALSHSRTFALEYLGRTDDQVKVRGFRIEPGEIEALLRRQPGVRDAVVAVREDAPGDRRLVAYLVSANGALPMDGIRAALRAELPAYMLPAAWVPIDALPLSPSGKVDRRALPPPASTEPIAASAPLSQRERAVAELWREVLGVEAVGPEDNFFDLGGNSLLLIRLAARLKDELGSTATAVDLFRFPTVRALAAHLAAGPRETQAPPGTRAEQLRQGTSRLLGLRRGGR